MQAFLRCHAGCSYTSWRRRPSGIRRPESRLAVEDDLENNRLETPRLGLLVLSKDRCGMLVEMLRSIRLQHHGDFRCIVLDNGSSDLSEAAFVRECGQDGRFEFRTWTARSSEENFQRAMDVGSSEFDWFAMLHDDDVLEPSWLELVAAGIAQNPTCSMICVNAVTFGASAELCGRVWYPGMEGRTRLLRTRSDVALWMIRYGGLNFPSTMYRSAAVAGWRLEQPFGKCSDQYLLLEVAGRGPVLIEGSPEYRYRLHAAQDSATMDEQEVHRLQDYIDSRLSIRVGPLGLLERNRRRMVQYRVFRQRGGDFTVSRMLAYMWKRRIFLLYPNDALRLAGLSAARLLSLLPGSARSRRRT